MKVLNNYEKTSVKILIVKFQKKRVKARMKKKVKKTNKIKKRIVSKTKSNS